MTIEIYARNEHPAHNTFYEDAMKRGGKKKKKASHKEPSNKNINKINITIGGKNKDDLYHALNQKMGGMGSSSSSMFPSTPSYYRLSAPALNQAIPAPLNVAIPNNFVNPLQPTQPLQQGSDRRREEIVPPQSSAPIVRPHLNVYGGSSAFTPVPPEPNRPISAVQSVLTAGRPIVNDPSLPRLRPTGRDNYVRPYQGQYDAPRSGYFPQNGMFPRTREQEESEDSEVGETKKKKPTKSLN